MNKTPSEKQNNPEVLLYDKAKKMLSINKINPAKFEFSIFKKSNNTTGSQYFIYKKVFSQKQNTAILLSINLLYIYYQITSFFYFEFFKIFML